MRNEIIVQITFWIQIILSRNCSPSNFRIYNNAHDILRSIDSSINNRKNAYVEHHNKDKTLKRVSWDTMSTEDKNGKEDLLKAIHFYTFHSIRITFF